jgi:hypothetical protein
MKELNYLYILVNKFSYIITDNERINGTWNKHMGMWEQFPAERKHENCHFNHTHTKLKYKFWKVENFLKYMVQV